MDEKPFREWYQTATPESIKLFEKVDGFADLLGDMIFSPGTPTYEFVKCQSKSPESGDWTDDVVLLPESLEYFSYTFFTYHVTSLNGFGGKFDWNNHSLTVDASNIDNDSVILHEMIHLHEFVINDLPMIYRDAIFYCLYKALVSKIPDLNKRIEAHGHILISNNLAAFGGVHDILFLLKSFALDLKMGYKLGTVFGYGMEKQWNSSAGDRT